MGRQTILRPIALSAILFLVSICDPSTSQAAKDSVSADQLASYIHLHAVTRGFQLGRPVQPLPTPDGKSVLFLRSGARDTDQQLYEFDVASGQSRAILNASQLLHGAEENLSSTERARRERMRLA